MTREALEESEEEVGAEGGSASRPCGRRSRPAEQSPLSPLSPLSAFRPLRAHRGRSARGFTLVEAIVVVALTGILVAIGFGELNKFSRREKLTTTSMQLSALLQKAGLAVRDQNAVVFVAVDAENPTIASSAPFWSEPFSFESAAYAGYVLPTFPPYIPIRWVRLVADTTGNGQFDDPAGTPGDTVIDAVALPAKEISLSTTDANGVEQSNWSLVPAGGKTAYVIGVNFRGQAIAANGTALPGPAVMAMTHRDMALGLLTPPINYQLRVTPVWDVSVRRLVDGKTY